MKKTLKTLYSVLRVILAIAGGILLYLGKAIKAAGYALKGFTGSAKAELKDFLTIYYDISDL